MRLPKVSDYCCSKHGRRYAGFKPVLINRVVYSLVMKFGIIGASQSHMG